MMALVKRYNKLGDFEITFDEFCELMEAERRDRKAFFISCVRVAVPKDGIQDYLMDSESSDRATIRGMLGPIFNEIDGSDGVADGELKHQNLSHEP